MVDHSTKGFTELRNHQYLLRNTNILLKDDTNECASNPCENGGSCIDDRNRFDCSCAPGYEGKFCEVQVDECQSFPCMNGATCINGRGR